jgi:tetratricopeptide (TPR) repeat protein
MNCGLALMKLERYEEAIIANDQAIHYKPDYYEAWNSKGCFLSHLKRYEEEIVCYEQAMQYQSLPYVALHNRGFALSRLQRYQEAVESYDQSLIYKSDYYDAWWGRGNALVELNRLEEALDAYEQAICSDPNVGKAWGNHGAVLLKLDRPQEAIVSLDRALSYDPVDLLVLVNHGTALTDLGRYEEAIESYKRVIALDPNSHESWNSQGDAFCKLEHYEEALAAYAQALELKPDYHISWSSRGDVLRNLERYEEALEAYEQTIHCKPDYYYGWERYGCTLDDLERYEEALEAYKQALQIKPDYYYAWSGNGSVLSSLGRYEDAITSHDKALYYDPESHHAWNSRSFAAYNSRHLGQPSSLTQTHPELNQRGYFGELASLTVGLIYCPANTHPLGHGFLQRALGNAHWFYGRRQSNPRYYRRQALTAYEASLRVLTASDHPESRLQTLQKLIRTHDALREIAPDAMLALLRQGTELRTRILTQARSDEQREKLTRTLPNFNELTVDFHLSQGDNIAAIETAEADKNGLMQWLISGTANYAQVREMLAPDRAIVYCYLSANAVTSFILRHDQTEPIVVTEFDREISLKMRDRLDKWIKEWNNNYNPKSKDADSVWQETLETELETLAEILEIPKLLPHLQNIQSLILVPHRDLHRFPLHIFFPQTQITYLPSLHLGRKLPAAPSTDPTLLTIEAPNHDGMEPLYHAAAESIVLHQLYPNYLHLPPDQASPEVFLQSIAQPHTHLHFNGHANHNLTDPKHSQLALTGNATLTLQEFINHPCRTTHLVTFAACETGITNAQTITSEYVGWVSACLGRGIPHVLSTLWTVQSEATALFMLYFYSQLQQHKSPILAHHQAQQWLRTLTVLNLRQFYATELFHIVNTNLEEFLEIEQYKLSKMDESDQPYAHPYYWAAFILSGRSSGL